MTSKGGKESDALARAFGALVEGLTFYDLGLVYNIELKPDEGKVDVKMTLTAPGCPASAYIHQDVKRKIEQLQGVKEATVNIVWDPPWTPEMMSETAKKQFGWGI